METERAAAFDADTTAGPVRVVHRSAWVVAAFLVLGRAISLLLNLGAEVAPDSVSYRVGGSAFRAVSFTGHWPRGWPITLPYALMPTDLARSVFQSFVATLMYLFLVVIVFRWLPRAVALPLSVGYVVISLTPQVLEWDKLILSESLATTLGLGVFACVLWFALRRTVASALCTSALLYLWVVARPSNSLALPAAVALSLVVLAASLRARVRRVAAGVLAASLVLASAGAYSYNSKAASQFSPDLRAITATYQWLAANPLANKLLVAIRQTEVPKCAVPAAPLDWGSQAKLWQELRSSCSGGAAWLAAHYPWWYARYLIRHPADCWTVVGEGFRRAVAGKAAYSSVTLSILPPTLAHMFFAPDNFGLQTPFVPMLGWLAAAAIGYGTVEAIFFMRRRARPRASAGAFGAGARAGGVAAPAALLRGAGAATFIAFAALMGGAVAQPGYQDNFRICFAAQVVCLVSTMTVVALSTYLLAGPTMGRDKVNSAAALAAKQSASNNAPNPRAALLQGNARSSGPRRPSWSGRRNS